MLTKRYLIKMEESKQNQEYKQKRNWYDKHYLHLLLIPVVVLLLSIFFMFNFYQTHDDLFLKDVSLTGGTTITIYDPLDIVQLQNDLSGKLDDFQIRSVSNTLTKEQLGVVITTKTEIEKSKSEIEIVLGYPLTEENSSIEFTGPSLSDSFYQQLIFSVLMAFLFMGFVVFLIFGTNRKIKFWTGLLTFLPAVVFFTGALNLNTVLILILFIFIINFYFFYKHSIPSVIVIIAAFANIFMTLAVVNSLGLRMSSAGIVALLMLIGYSVDTDIMLTNRLLRRGEEGGVNERLVQALKTGLTMTLTSLSTIIVALLIVRSFSDVLTQIFTILIIGLFFDMFNTWLTNASLIKWYVESKNFKETQK